MIIKTGCIKAGHGQRITSYAVLEAQNERVDVLKDEGEQLMVSDDFALAKGRKHGLLHIIISPGQDLSPAELETTLSAIRQEFGYNPCDPETLATHQSKRADGSTQKHYHFVRPAANSETGKTYQLFRSRGKDEAVSRLCELQFGHSLTPGANNKFAEMRLREMGKNDLADRLAEAFRDQDNTTAAYSRKDHQQAKRQGFDLPSLRQHLKDIADLPRVQQPAMLAEVINDKGLDLADAVTQGRGRSRITILTPEGLKDHNANRTLKIKATQTSEFIAETQVQLRKLRTARTLTDTVSSPHKNNPKEQHYAEPSDRPNMQNDQQANSDTGKQSADADAGQQHANTSKQADSYSERTGEVSKSDHERSETEASAVLSEAASSTEVQNALARMNSIPASGVAISSSVMPIPPPDLSKPGAAAKALQMWSRLMKRLLQKQNEQERAARRNYIASPVQPKPPWG